MPPQTKSKKVWNTAQFFEQEILFHSNVNNKKTYRNNKSYWFGGRLKYIKLKKCFSLPTSNKFAVKNNEIVELRLIFHKTINKNNLKVWKFQSHKLNNFSANKKTVTSVKGGGGMGLFLSLFLSVHNKYSNINWILITVFLYSYDSFQFIFFYWFSDFLSSGISLSFSLIYLYWFFLICNFPL